jgi:hypothetical protein
MTSVTAWKEGDDIYCYKVLLSSGLKTLRKPMQMSQNDAVLAAFRNRYLSSTL